MSRRAMLFNPAIAAGRARWWPGQRRPRVPRPRSGHGFTLLEILVVVLIIGIVLSLATLAFRDDVNERLETEVRRLAALIGLATQETVLQAKEMAVVFTEQGYHFLQLEKDQWADPADPVFRARAFPEDISLFIEIEGATVAAGQEEESRDERVYLLSSGEMTPFVLTLKHRDSTATYEIRGAIDGKLTLGP